MQRPGSRRKTKPNHIRGCLFGNFQHPTALLGLFLGCLCPLMLYFFHIFPDPTLLWCISGQWWGSPADHTAESCSGCMERLQLWAVAPLSSPASVLHTMVWLCLWVVWFGFGQATALRSKTLHKSHDCQLAKRRLRAQSCQYRALKEGYEIILIGFSFALLFLYCISQRSASEKSPVGSSLLMPKLSLEFLKQAGQPCSREPTWEQDPPYLN